MAVCVRQATMEDLLAMQRCNLLCLPENYQLKVRGRESGRGNGTERGGGQWGRSTAPRVNLVLLPFFHLPFRFSTITTTS